jgi:hypothetical protein
MYCSRSAKGLVRANVSMSRLSRAACTLLLVAATIIDLAPAARAAPVLVWEQTIPSPGIIVGSSPTPVTLADGSKGIVLGSRDGNVYVLRASDGTTAPGWPQSTGNPIDSSAAVADTDGSGKDSIFIGSGVAQPQVGLTPPPGQGGGLFSYDTGGRLRWKVLPQDPSAPNLSVNASPALGDINGDCTPDVTVGDLGQSIVSVKQGDGAANPGWPYLALDSVFSSAALADVNGNGQTDVVDGGDSFPGNNNHPRGGLVRALSGSGQTLWEFRIDEQVRSSPSIGDIDGDGKPDIVFGAGDFWSHQPGGSRDFNKVFALNLDGTLKPGWPKTTDNYTIGSPTLADVNGDGRLDVVIGTWNPNPVVGATGGPGAGSLYAWDGKTGNEIWSHRVATPGTVIIGQIVTADFNGDGAQDLLVPTSSGAFALDGRTGQPLFSIEGGRVSLQNSPLITDLGNGTLSVILAGEGANNTGLVARWDVPVSDRASLGNLGWPMFRKDPRHTGSWTNPPLTQAITKIATQASGTVSMGGTIRDSATLSSCGHAPTGTITFTLFHPGDTNCVTPIFSSTVPVDGTGHATSGAYTATDAGTYRWTSRYSGDGNNNPATSACSDPRETVSVNQGTQAPAVRISPPTLAFPGQAVGTKSPPQTVTLTSSGTAPVVIGAALIGGANAGDFAKVADRCSGTTLAPGMSCAVQVLFAPSVGGPRSAALEFADNVPPGVQGVTLVGNLAVLTLDPPIGPPGFVTVARGIGFPAGASVRLSWDRGIGTVNTKADAQGGLRVPVLIFLHDRLGQRNLTASGTGGFTFVPASATFLAVAPPVQAPDLIQRR